MTNLNNLVLNNLDNYKKELNSTVVDIFIQYINLTNEFIIQCCENIYTKNKNYNRYIINKGVETLSHIFEILLFYTLNLELTYHHCQKSLFYYIEFIGQIIGENQFLKLTLKDSALFIYKKTIFDINNEHKNSFTIKEHDNMKLQIINYLIKIYNSLIYLLLDNHEFPQDNQSSLLNEMTNSVQKIANNIINSFNNKEDVNFIEKLKIIEYFIEYIKNKAETIKDGELTIFSFIDSFIKKLSKTNLTLDKLITKLNNDTIDILFREKKCKRLIKWIFS